MNLSAIRVGLIAAPLFAGLFRWSREARRRGLYRELFIQYEEFTGVDTMLQERILTCSEEAELRGMEKGMEKGKEEMAKNLLTNGVSPDIIAKSAGLTVEQVRRLIN